MSWLYNLQETLNSNIYCIVSFQIFEVVKLSNSLQGDFKGKKVFLWWWGEKKG